MNYRTKVLPAYVMGACLTLFFGALFAASTIFSQSATAGVESINQCTDPTLSDEAIFQLGLFVSNPNYQETTKLDVGPVIKNNWKYTYFNGNSAEEIISLRAPLGDAQTIITSDDGSEIITGTINFPEVGKYTVLAYGSGGNSGLQPIQYGVFQDELTKISAGKGKVRIIHASGFHENLNNMILDVRYDLGAEIVINNLAFGEQGFFEVEPGPVKIQAADQTGDFVLFDINSFDIAEGELVTLILYGDDAASMDVYTLSNCQSLYRYNQLISPPQFPRFEGSIHFVNLAPSSSQLDATKMSLFLNGAKQIEELPYGQSSGEIQVEAETYTAQIKNNGSDLVVATTEIEIEKDKAYTLVATGGASGVDFELTVLEDPSPNLSLGNWGLRFGNFITDPDTSKKLKLVDEISGVIDLDSVLVGEISEPAVQQFAAGTYDLDIHLGPVSLIDPEPAPFAADQSVTLLAAGNGVEQPHGLFRFQNGVPGELMSLEAARLYVAHLAPFASAPEDTSVTLKINGQLVDDFSTYGDSTGFVSLPAGDQTISIEQSGVPLVTRDLTLSGNEEYVVLFSGSANEVTLSEPIQLNEPAAGEITIYFGNQSPELQAARFDNLLGPVSPLLTYGQTVVSNVVTDPGDLNLMVEDDAGLELFNPNPVTLLENDIALFFVVENQAFIDQSVYAIMNGQRGIFLEPEIEVANLYIANLLALDAVSSNPTISVDFNGVELVDQLQFGKSSAGTLEVPVGTGLIEVFSGNNPTPILTQEITTAKDQTYQLFVHGNEQAPSMIFRSEPLAIQLATFALSAGNLAPDSAGLFRSINVYQNDVLVADNLASGELQPSFARTETTTSTFKITTGSGSHVLLETQEVNFAENSTVNILAAGDGGINQPFGLYAIVDNQEMVLLPQVEGEEGDVPNLSIGHFGILDSASSTIRVRLNDELLERALAYGEFLLDVEGVLGSNKIEFLEPGSLEVLAEANTVLLSSGESNLTLLVGGQGAFSPLALNHPFQSIELFNNQATVSFLNGASINGLLPDFAMTLNLDNQQSSELDATFPSVEYGKTGSAQLEVGTYDPILESADGSTTFANPGNVTFAQGDRILLAAIGDGSARPIQMVQIQLKNGSMSATTISNESGIVDFSESIFLPLVIR